MKNQYIALGLTTAYITSTASAASSCSTKSNVKVTFYGWPDNSPPGPANAFDCGRGKTSDGEPIAGGTGTYADPISFATATDNSFFPQCGIVYVPSLRKYFRNEDDCAECKSDYDSNGAFHIDLWTGSNTRGGDQTQIDCENNLPGGQLTIVNDPPSGLQVDTTPLFDVDSGTCSKTTYPVSDESSLCAGGGGSSGVTSSIQPLAPSTTSGQTPTTFSTVTSVASSPSSSSTAACTWEGHCLGAPCKDENDCDGSNVCGDSGVCVPLGSS